MAMENKKYLDLAGVDHLIKQKAILKHPTTEVKTEGAYKFATDSNGHIIVGGQLTAEDLGLESALSFAGITNEALTDGCTTKPIMLRDANNNNEFTKSYNQVAGAVVLVYDATSNTTSKEFIWDGAQWEELGDSASHALKSIRVDGDGVYLTGGGSLAQNITICHAAGKEANTAAKVYKFSNDTAGHVTVAGAASLEAAGGHIHNVKLPANTFITSVTPTNNKIDIDAKTASFLTAATPQTQALVTTSITGVNGSTSASKATQGAAKVVATKGNDFSVLAALNDAAFQAKVGNAKISAGSGVKAVTGYEDAAKPAFYAAVTGNVLELTAVNLAFSEEIPLVETADTLFSDLVKTEVITGVAGTESINTYSFSDVTVPVAAAAATTVATGSISNTGLGDSVVIGVDTTENSALISTTTLKTSTSGVSVVTGVAQDKNTEFTLTGAALTNGEHTHEFA